MSPPSASLFGSAQPLRHTVAPDGEDGRWARRWSGFLGAACGQLGFAPEACDHPIALFDLTLFGTGTAGVLLTAERVVFIDANGVGKDKLTGWMRVADLAEVHPLDGSATLLQLDGTGWIAAPAKGIWGKRSIPPAAEQEPGHVRPIVDLKEDRDAWVAVLNRVRTAVADGSWSPPSTENTLVAADSDDSPANCVTCGTRFTWYWTHRHKCQGCSQVMCGSCVKTEVWSPQSVRDLDPKTQRVCSACGERLLAELEREGLDEVADIYTKAHKMGDEEGHSGSTNSRKLAELTAFVEVHTNTLVQDAFRTAYDRGFDEGRKRKIQEAESARREQLAQTAALLDNLRDRRKD